MKKGSWSFIGDDAELTAIHHAKHLAQFIEREKLNAECGYEKTGEYSFISFITATGNDFDKIQLALKPRIITDINIE